MIVKNITVLKKGKYKLFKRAEVKEQYMYL